MSSPEQFFVNPPTNVQVPKGYFPPAVSASRISGVLGTQFVRFNGNSDTGGYRVFQMTDEKAEFPVAVVEYHNVRKDLGPGRYSDAKIWSANRKKLVEIREFLRANHYTVTWGWDEASGEPDTTWLAVVTPKMLQKQKELEAALTSEEQDAADPPTEIFSDELLGLTLTQAEKAVLEIVRAYNAGKDEAARRMEFQLYRAVLTSIILGSKDGIDLSAIAIATQKLYFAR